MKMNKLIKKRFESVFEEYGIKYVDNVLESGTWRCVKVRSDFKSITNSKAYDCEMLIDESDYGSYFENELDYNSLLYKMKTILNVLEVNADPAEKNRVKVVFSTQVFFIEGRC